MNTEILEKLKTYDMVIGIDEVGRGPIAGPVTVCAFGVTLQYYTEVLEKLAGITDSKKLTENKREAFVEIARSLKAEGKIIASVASVSAKNIDANGIISALHAALKQSLIKTVGGHKKAYIYLDGSLSAPDNFDQETIIKGDGKNWLIGAASVVAKVTRDNMMKKYAEKFPGYGFDRHKGYGTKAHYAVIQEKGMTDIHRKTWVKN